VDSQQLAGGDKLTPRKYKTRFKEKTHFIAVLSPKTINSPWVKKRNRLRARTQQESDPRNAAGHQAECAGILVRFEPHNEQSA